LLHGGGKHAIDGAPGLLDLGGERLAELLLQLSAPTATEIIDMSLVPCSLRSVRKSLRTDGSSANRRL
jgi:hypothetical protein